jgi:cytochrome c peroxidase
MRSLRAWTLATVIAGVVAIGVACTRSSSGRGGFDGPPEVDPLARLRAFESERRAGAHFLETPGQEGSTGADPYDVVALRDGRFAGILRGRDALVLLDAELRETSRIPTPRSPSAIAVYDGKRVGDMQPGDILVASEIEPLVARYRVHERSIERLRDVRLGSDVLRAGEALGVRDIAVGPEGTVYVVEEHSDRLISFRFERQRSGEGTIYDERFVPAGPLRIARTSAGVFVMSLLAHEIDVYRVDEHGMPTGAKSAAKLDGPYWGLGAIDIADTAGDALLIAGGAEDRPLDRREGFFGYVDSFVYVHRWHARTGELERIGAIDVSEHGLILPKAMAFDHGARGSANTSGEPRARLRGSASRVFESAPGPRGGAPVGDGAGFGAEPHVDKTPSALVTSYGAARAVRLTWSHGMNALPDITPFDAPPGISAVVDSPSAGGFIAADPLLDAWVRIDAQTARTSTVHADDAREARSDREKLGEALFFTGLMAPSSTAEGAKSRFSCETCHFEGYVDGRTHHTGRGSVRATTKPLVGLFNNRPHFSRALDPDLSAVAENEFRVAGAPSAADPHFDIDVKDVPWLADLGIAARRWDAAELRLSLMSFLMTWTHRTNPRAAQLRSLTDEQRRGAALFRDRCEACHQARASADDPASRVPFERWEELVLGGKGPIVWASDAYEKTGIEPYVHERGARVPSLRRLYKKRPYFTNGSAQSLADVVRSARYRRTGFEHHAAGVDDGMGPGAGADADSSKRLDEPTIAAIVAFIDLL